MNKLLLLSFFFIFSCAHTSENYDAYSFEILLEKGLKLNSVSAEIKSLSDQKPEDDYIPYKLDFRKVKGGSTFFLGKKIKEGNGYTSKRLMVSDESGDVIALSIEDLLNWEEFMDDKIIIK